MDKKTQGKKNRASGQRFELKVRIDLESNGWIVDKWTNNVEFDTGYNIPKGKDELCNGRLIKAKSNRFNMRSTGFPDFLCFRKSACWNCVAHGFGKCSYEVIGVECKGGDAKHKYLDKVEKAKCSWLLENKIFGRILIASKGKKRGEIIYKEFKT